MNYAEISVAGVPLKVPSAEIDGKTVIVTGKWLRVAAVKDEDWQEGEVVLSPDEFLANVHLHRGFRPDIFSFSQKPTDPTPRFPFQYELESVAAIRTTSFSEWWTNRVSTDLRRDVRKAAKLGVVVRRVAFDDELVRGIMEIYDETPVRQGVPFWHYKKGFEAVKQANATYLQRSDFLGAFCGNELIGFVKIVYVGPLARLMQIISKDAHRDKRPANALIAQAVELCAAKGCSILTYGSYQYTKGADSLTAFKHRNGFEEVLVPRYYIPLTTKGRLACCVGLHRGVKAMVPKAVLRSLKRVRAFAYRHLLLT